MKKLVIVTISIGIGFALMSFFAFSKYTFTKAFAENSVIKQDEVICPNGHCDDLIFTSKQRSDVCCNTSTSDCACVDFTVLGIYDIRYKLPKHLIRYLV